MRSSASMAPSRSRCSSFRRASSVSNSTSSFSLRSSAIAAPSCAASYGGSTRPQLCAERSGGASFAVACRGSVEIAGCLFDHLVGASEEGGRDGEAERLGGLQVDRELEL